MLPPPAVAPPTPDPDTIPTQPPCKHVDSSNLTVHCKEKFAKSSGSFGNTSHSTYVAAVGKLKSLPASGSFAKQFGKAFLKSFNNHEALASRTFVEVFG